MKRTAVKTIREHGLIDTFKAVNKGFDFTIPTDYISNDKSTGIRMDYIFCSEDFRVLEAYVVRNKFTEKASDHYPVVAVLKI